MRRSLERVRMRVKGLSERRVCLIRRCSERRWVFDKWRSRSIDRDVRRPRGRSHWRLSGTRKTTIGVGLGMMWRVPYMNLLGNGRTPTTKSNGARGGDDTQRETNGNKWMRWRWKSFFSSRFSPSHVGAKLRRASCISPRAVTLTLPCGCCATSVTARHQLATIMAKRGCCDWHRAQRFLHVENIYTATGSCFTIHRSSTQLHCLPLPSSCSSNAVSKLAP